MKSKPSLTPSDDATFGRLVGATTNLVKTTVGIANNAAWMACLDAMDQIRKHPDYRRQVKGGTTPAREFRRCFGLLKQYERGLKYSVDYPWFCVADMSPEERKAYGPDFTDADLYEYWSSFGFTAYSKTKPFFTSLVNKIRLAYLHHGDPQPDIMGWAVAAQCALDIAARIWDSAIRACVTMEHDYLRRGIPKSRWERTYRDFCLRSVADFWEKCVDTLNPNATFTVPQTDQENIYAGYLQLEQQWMDTDTIYGSRIQTAEDFADIFRTNGEMKKQMRQFAEARERVEQALD